MLGSAIGTMFTLKAQAQKLMQMPTEDGLATAGPTFEYVPPDRRAAKPKSDGKTPERLYPEQHFKIVSQNDGRFGLSGYNRQL